MIDVVNGVIDFNKIEVADVVDLKMLKSFLDNFALSMNCATVAVDHEGNMVDGDAILYIRDGYNGSGDYCMGKKFITIDYKNNKTAYENMDYGKYSLGDVFGTSDWSY